MRFILAALALLIPVVGHATTVRQAGLDELVRESHMVVRAHVAFVDDRVGETTGKYQTRVGLEIDEAVMGFDSRDGVYELVLPGGSIGPYTMKIPGMPSFVPNQEVVLLVTHTPGGDAITGLAQGVFRVDRGNGAARARRLDLDDVRVVDAKGRDARPDFVDAPLASLMSQLRHLSAGVRR